MTDLKQRLNDLKNRPLVTNEQQQGFDVLAPMMLELVDALNKVKPSLNIAFEDTNDLYYMNVKEELNEALNKFEKWLEE